YQRDRLVMLMRPDHPLAGRPRINYVETLDYEQIGLHALSSIYTRSLMAAREAGRPLRRRIHVPSFDAACRTVAANLGIALMPEPVFAVLGRPMNLHAVALDDPWAQRELLLLTKPGAVLQPSAALLRSHLLRSQDEKTP